MANRPVFVPLQTPPYVEDVDTEFKFYPGLSVKQKRRCIFSMQESFREDFPDAKILEVSTKSDIELGVRLSAFNLMIHHPDVGECSVECAFEASKQFEHGGPYKDLLRVSSLEAKRDSRLKQSGDVVGFEFLEREFPPEPKTYFYDWIYATALLREPDLLEAALSYDAFSDIEFNPKKVTSCQARAVAKMVGLAREGLLENAMKSPEDFLRIGYVKG